MIWRPRGGLEARRWAIPLNATIIVLFVLAIVIAETGGLRERWFGVTISLRRASRPALLAVLLWTIRAWLAPEFPLLGQRFRMHRVDEAAITERRAVGVAPTLAVAALALVLTVAMTWPQARDLGSVPDLGDPLFSTWRLAWVAHQVTTDPGHLFDGNIFYPERNTLGYSDSTLFEAALAAPLIWSGVPPVVAYNLVFLSAFVLSIVATFLFLRALIGDAAAAVVGALIFGFYPYRFEHYSHLEHQMTFWIPLALWALHRTLENGRLRDGLLTGAAIAGQMFSSMYTALFVVTYFVPLVVVRRMLKGPSRGAFRSLAAGALLSSALVAPLAVPYVENRSVVGERAWPEVEYYSARPQDYLAAHPRIAMWGWMRGTNRIERQLFPGVLPIALAIAGLWPPLSATRIAYAAALGVAFDASLGFHGALYEQLYTYLFPFRGLRVPARFSMLVGFTLAVLAAYGVSRLRRRVRGRRAGFVAVSLLSALVLIEARPRIELVPVWPTAPVVYQQLPIDAVVAEFPAPDEPAASPFDTRYEYFSTSHWRRMLNGNSGFLPPSYLEFVVRARSFPGPDALAYLASRQVDYVVVHGAFMDQQRYAEVRRVLDSSPAVALAQRFSWDGREGSVYRLVRRGPAVTTRADPVTLTLQSQR